MSSNVRHIITKKILCRTTVVRQRIFILSCRPKSGDRTTFLLYLLNDGLESVRVVDCEVSKNLTVDFNTILVESTHELAVAQVIETCSSIDTLNPQSTEVTLLITTVAISIGETLLISILRNGPDILTGTIVTLGLLQKSCSLCF